MQRAASSTDISSLLHHPAPAQHQPLQHPMAYHDHERSQYPGQSGLGALLPPLGMGGPQDMHDQRTELPRPYKCPLCDKAFHRLEHQTRHIRTHTGEKPHACSFPGCTKRFSRSDELTRHSRIHTNPNSRRSNKQHASGLSSVPQAESSTSRMMPPPTKLISKSAPASHVGSPNVSPPHSYHGIHVPSIHSGLSPFSRATSSPALSSGHHMGLDLSTLAHTASQQLEREKQPYHGYSQYYGSRYANQLPPLSQQYNSHPMSRSHSHEDDDPYVAHRSVKKSRPSSPVSTAPSSPTFSHGSCSPTPESTPLATPAHSPRLYPRDNDYTMSMQLPSIRHLSLRHMPALAPMEVADPYNANSGGPPTSSSQPMSNSLRLGDIINRPDGAQRKLPVPPVPKVTIHDLLNEGGRYGLQVSSTTSSTSNSLAGGDLADRI